MEFESQRPVTWQQQLDHQPRQGPNLAGSVNQDCRTAARSTSAESAASRGYSVKGILNTLKKGTSGSGNAKSSGSRGSGSRGADGGGTRRSGSGGVGAESPRSPLNTITSRRMVPEMGRLDVNKRGSANAAAAAFADESNLSSQAPQAAAQRSPLPHPRYLASPQVAAPRNVAPLQQRPAPSPCGKPPASPTPSASSAQSSAHNNARRFNSCPARSEAQKVPPFPASNAASASAPAAAAISSFPLVKMWAKQAKQTKPAKPAKGKPSEGSDLKTEFSPPSRGGPSAEAHPRNVGCGSGRIAPETTAEEDDSAFDGASDGGDSDDEFVGLYWTAMEHRQAANAALSTALERLGVGAAAGRNSHRAGTGEPALGGSARAGSGRKGEAESSGVGRRRSSSFGDIAEEPRGGQGEGGEQFSWEQAEVSPGSGVSGEGGNQMGSGRPPVSTLDGAACSGDKDGRPGHRRRHSMTCIDSELKEFLDLVDLEESDELAEDGDDVSLPPCAAPMAAAAAPPPAAAAAAAAHRSKPRAALTHSGPLNTTAARLACRRRSLTCVDSELKEFLDLIDGDEEEGEGEDASLSAMGFAGEAAAAAAALPSAPPAHSSISASPATVIATVGSCRSHRRRHSITCIDSELKEFLDLVDSEGEEGEEGEETEKCLEQGEEACVADGATSAAAINAAGSGTNRVVHFPPALRNATLPTLGAQLGAGRSIVKTLSAASSNSAFSFGYDNNLDNGLDNNLDDLPLGFSASPLASPFRITPASPLTALSPSATAARSPHTAAAKAGNSGSGNAHRRGASTASAAEVLWATGAAGAAGAAAEGARRASIDRSSIASLWAVASQTPSPCGNCTPVTSPPALKTQQHQSAFQASSIPPATRTPVTSPPALRVTQTPVPLGGPQVQRGAVRSRSSQQGGSVQVHGTGNGAAVIGGAGGGGQMRRRSSVGDLTDMSSSIETSCLDMSSDATGGLISSSSITSSSSSSSEQPRKMCIKEARRLAGVCYPSLAAGPPAPAGTFAPPPASKQAEGISKFAPAPKSVYQGPRSPPLSGSARLARPATPGAPSLGAAGDDNSATPHSASGFKGAQQARPHHRRCSSAVAGSAICAFPSGLSGQGHNSGRLLPVVGYSPVSAAVQKAGCGSRNPRDSGNDFCVNSLQYALEAAQLGQAYAKHVAFA